MCLQCACVVSCYCCSENHGEIRPDKDVIDTDKFIVTAVHKHILGDFIIHNKEQRFLELCLPDTILHMSET